MNHNEKVTSIGVVRNEKVTLIGVVRNGLWYPMMNNYLILIKDEISIFTLIFY